MVELTKVDLGSFIKDLRVKRDMNLVQLSEKSGISTAQISRIENGKRKTPRPETLKQLADSLEIPHEQMLRAAGYLD